MSDSVPLKLLTFDFTISYHGLMVMSDCQILMRLILYLAANYLGLKSIYVSY